MERTLAKKIKKLWNENFAGYTNATKTKATVTHSGYGHYDVAILPDADNTGGTFFHTEEVASVARAFRVSAMITMEEYKKRTVIVGRLF